MKTMLPALAALIFLSACGEPVQTSTSSQEAGSFVVTDYTETTELFVEFRPLVVDRRRRFDAHLSRLADYRAVADGRLIAELVWPDGHVDRAEATVSDTSGIFRPLLTASRAGAAQLTLRWEGTDAQSIHELGAVEVFSSGEASASAAPPHVENPQRIAFPKEAQWRVPFRTLTTNLGDLEQTIPVTVDVQFAPNAEAYITAPVAGIIQDRPEIPVIGASVRAGEQLAMISARLGAGEDLAGLELAISEARIELDAARSEARRMEQLVQAEAAPLRRLDEAQTAEQLAQARLNTAQRRRSSLAGGGSGVPLVAPISGRIVASNIVRGGAVEAGAEVLRVGDPESLWLVARIPESQTTGIGNPTNLHITVAGQTVDLDGLTPISGIGPVDPRTRTADAIFSYSGTRLTPGLRVPALLATDHVRKVLSVPASAILNEAGQDVVYVQVSGEAFERRMIVRGVKSGDRVAVSGDLQPGERVVTEGAAAVRAAAATPDAFGHGHAH